MDRGWLQGAIGDALHALSRAAGRRAPRRGVRIWPAQKTEKERGCRASPWSMMPASSQS